MSESWLKPIGTTEEPCLVSYNRSHVDSSRPMSGIQRGDHLVLYAVGAEKPVFALAQVTSEVYESGQKGWPYRVDIRYEINLRVEDGVSLDNIRTPERGLIGPIQRGHSYIKLRPEEFERAVARLREAAGGAPGAPA